MILLDEVFKKPNILSPILKEAHNNILNDVKGKKSTFDIEKIQTYL